MSECTDRVVGKILAGWPYDISAIVPVMRGDYSAHLQECAYCHSRQKIHRAVDIGLIVLGAISATLFLIGFAIVKYFEPKHAFILELIALGGFLLSAVIWLIVAIATPAPVVVIGAARTGVRIVHDR